MRIVIDGTEAGGYSVPKSRRNCQAARNDPRRRPAKKLMRFVVRHARCVRDDLTGALAKSPEIDGRDLAAFLEKDRYTVPEVRFGPPFLPVPFLALVLARHGNTICPPCPTFLTNIHRVGSPTYAQYALRFLITF
jgi:hypothetical protein